MTKSFRDAVKKNRIVICINVGLLIAAAVLCVVSGKMKNTLESQQFADRWSADENYGQASVFFSDFSGLSEEEINSAVTGFNNALSEAGIIGDGSEGEELIWTYGYSGESSLSVNWGNTSVEANATGIGGNFFMFHPLRLKSGSYIYGSDLMQDRVVIDDNLAWQIFGASDVAGMEITIGGLSYTVAGVVVAEDDFSSIAIYGEKPRIYLSYEALCRINENASITCFEVLMPSSIDGFVLVTTQSVFESAGIDETTIDIVENTSRYSVSSLFEVIGDYGLRSVRQVGFTYPYWENAARIITDYLALFLVVTLLLLVFPMTSLVILIVRLWRRRKWRVKDIKEFIERKIEAHRERESLGD